MSSFQIIFTTLWLAVCGYSIVRGGLPERLVAAIFMVGAVASDFVQTGGGRSFHGIEPGIMTVDGSMFVLLVGLALVSARFWPMAMASLQGAQLLAHVMRLIERGTLPASYFVMAVMWSLPMLMLLAIGTWRHQRRRRAYGLDYSWVRQLPAAYRAGASADARP